MITLCLLLIPLSLALSAPLTWWLIGWGVRRGRLDTPGGHKGHERPVPCTGGIAIFAAVAAPLLVAILAITFLPDGFWTGRLAAVAEHLPGLRRTRPLALGILIALGIMHVLGLVDDRRGLRAAVKLMIELMVAAALVLAFDMRIFSFLAELGVFGTFASIVLSILWIAAVTNAMNMLDNMDGLSAGVGAIIAALYLAATLLSGQWFIAALCALLVGALVGFLIFNFPPAKVFMGDGGSLVLGMLIAIISIRTTYFASDTASFRAEAPLPPAQNWYGLLMPLMVLAVPLYDLCSVTLIRLRAGRSPFSADQNHFSHRLVRLGLSRRAAVVLIWLCTLATGLSGVMLGRLEAWQAILAGAQSAAVLAMLGILEWRRRG